MRLQSTGTTQKIRTVPGIKSIVIPAVNFHYSEVLRQGPSTQGPSPKEKGEGRLPLNM